MVVSAKKTTKMQLKNTERCIGYHGNNDNNTQKCQQKLFRRASSLSSSSLFSFRGIVLITQALIFFHILLVDGSVPTGEPPRLRKDNQEQSTSSYSEGTELRTVRREIMLEEVLFYNDIFASDPPIPTVKSAIITSAPSAIPNPTADISEEPTASNVSIIENSDGDSPWDTSENDVYIYNVTDDDPEPTSDDPFFDEATLESQKPSEVPSTSPIKITFLPVQILEDPDDPLVELGLTPSNQPTDSIDSKIDQTDSPETAGFLWTLTGEPIVDATPEPQPDPTGEPTRSPTFRPSSPPSEKPTAVLTQRPTEVPTPNPTFKPTRIPTRIPTGSPTGTPTGTPSITPTGTPSITPTRTPTSTPSFQPTSQPTLSPSSNPTEMPTNKPSYRPTLEPTITRSQDPTPSGTLEPSVSSFPSVPPSKSHQPTSYPTRSPSATPTIAPTFLLHSSEVSGEMELFPLSHQLRGRDAFNWETVTESFIEKFLLSNEVDLRLSIAEIRANIEDQYTGVSVQDATGTTRRFLQEANSDTLVDSLVIQFKIFMKYRSNADDIDVNQLVWSAFSSPEKQAEYILDLQEESDSDVFEPVREVELAVEGYVPSPTQAPGPGPDEGIGIAVIVGASVGSVALIILIMLLLLRRRSGKSEEERGVTETQATPSTQKNIKVSTEILVEPQDDVSTLGDPMFGQGGMMMGGMERDEMTAT
jgi:hypothetical protein